MTIKNIAKVVISMALVVVLTTGCFMSKEENEVLKTQNERVQKFLVEKYGKEFDIGESKYYRRALGDTPSIRTEVTSRDEEPIEFMVVSTKDGDPVGETAPIKEIGANFGGSYLAKKWQQEASELYKPLADEIFGEDVLISVKVEPISMEGVSKDNKLPKYEELDKSNEKMFKSTAKTHSFVMIVFKDLKTTDFDIEKKKLLTFMEYLIKEGLINSQFHIDYYDLTIEKPIREYVQNRKLNGVEIVGEVEGGYYGSMDYKRLNKEYYYIATSFNYKNDTNKDEITFKHMINREDENNGNN